MEVNRKIIKTPDSHPVAGTFDMSRLRGLGQWVGGLGGLGPYMGHQA